MTSKAPGSGTSISSSWNAWTGSPSRSSRITQAAIVSGSSPGSVLTSVTSVRSTWAMRSSRSPRSWAAHGTAAPSRPRPRLGAKQLVLAGGPLTPDHELGRRDRLGACDRTLGAGADRVAPLLDVGLDRRRVLGVDRPDLLALALALEDH